jgi:amidase
MSGFTEFDQYDGIGLAALVRRREVTPDEVLEAAISRVEARNPAVNAVVSRLYDEARAAIHAELPVGPFTGVPYLLKDLGAYYSGAITSFGSRFFADYRADHDSELTARP